MTTQQTDILLARQLDALKKARRQIETLAAKVNQPIAVVGMGCRFPGADHPEALWQLLIEEREALSDVPADRWDIEQYYAQAPAPGEDAQPFKTYARRAGYLDSADLFDARFFGISPREAQSIDPQQRLLLEVSYEAFENALMPVSDLHGQAVGVFVGISSSEYAVLTFGKQRKNSQDAYSITGTSMNSAAGRLSFYYGFNGPAMALDTACSSSLVAIYQACRSLINEECHTAVAGGVNYLLTPEPSIALAQNKVLSASGHCSPFSAAADGLVRGEGCGVIILRRLSDALAEGNRILGVIRAGHVNQDGASSGLTVPNGFAQRELVDVALKKARLSPQAIQFVETHGTGTVLGDPIEINALSRSLCLNRDRHAALKVGSIKANIGHLEAASGVAGVIKILLAFKHRQLPPQINLGRKNPHIDWSALALNVVDRVLSIEYSEDKPYYAGVSSFGFSGTNAHLIIQDPLSAAAEQTGAASAAGKNNVAGKAGTLPDVQVLALSAKDEKALYRQYDLYRDLLSQESDWRAVCAAHNSGRSQYGYRKAFVAGDKAALLELLEQARQARAFKDGREPKPFAWLFAGQWEAYAGMGRALYAAQPLFKTLVEQCDQALEEHLGRSLLPMLWGEESRLLDSARYGQPALFCLQYALSQYLLALNAKPHYVLGCDAGEYAAAVAAGVFSLQDAARMIVHRGRLTDELDAPEKIQAVFAEIVAKTQFHLPNTTFFSGHMGKIVFAEVAEAHYWIEQAGETASLQQTVQTLLQPHDRDPSDIDVCLVIGPDNQIAYTAGTSEQHASVHWHSLLGPQDDLTPFALSLQALFENGENLRWAQCCGAGVSADVQLPNYPFDRQRYWLPDCMQNALPAQHRYYHLEWQSAPLLLKTAPPKTASESKTWLIFSDASPFAQQLQQTLEQQAHKVETISATEFFADRENIQQMFQGLLADQPVDEVVYCWGRGEQTAATINNSLYTFVLLLKELLLKENLSAPRSRPLNLRCVLQGEAGAYRPFEACFAGLCRAFNRENPACGVYTIGLDNQMAPDRQVAAFIRETLQAGADKEVCYVDNARLVPRLCLSDADSETVSGAENSIGVHPDRTYLVTGATGALGQVFIRALINLGARHIVAPIRKNADSEKRAEQLESIFSDLCAEKGAHLHVHRADIGSRAGMEKLFAELTENYPALAGVVHAAGAVKDGALPSLTAADFERVMEPKVQAAWYLHELTRELELDFFILLSSVASILGAPGQTNYAAANAFLDALAASRRQQGLPGLSLNLGPVDGKGMAKRETLSKNFQRSGLVALDAAWLGGELRRLISCVDSHRVVAAFDWPQVKARYGVQELPVLSEFLFAPLKRVHNSVDRVAENAATLHTEADVAWVVRQCIASVLGIDDIRGVDDKYTLNELGMDSVTLIQLRNALGRAFDCSLDANIMFDFPKVGKLVQYFTARQFKQNAEANIVSTRELAPEDSTRAEEVAIIGIGCRFPGQIDSPEKFWEVLLAGTDTIAEMDQLRWDMRAYFEQNSGNNSICTARAGLIDHIDYFDCGLFGLSPREAYFMDPQQRLLLEVCWEVLERANYDFSAQDVSGGVFIGPGPNDYARRFDRDPQALTHHLSTGNALSVVAGRLAFLLDWQGPALVVDTACSSSLVAVHLAANALKNRECDIALAGGVNLLLAPETSVMLSKGDMLAADGRCKTFDAAADGYVRSEGCALVVLKRLRDAVAGADTVLAVIKGSAVNQDGHSQGLTAPNGQAQQKVIGAALRNAGLNAADIGMVETHGTGTPLGDPIEIAALNHMYIQGSGRANPLWVASVKTNLGHTEAAAGIAGLIKAVLCLQHRTIVQHLHFQQLNPEIHIDSHALRIPQKNYRWESDKARCAAVSSFGFSGTNVHMIVQEVSAQDSALPAAPEYKTDTQAFVPEAVGLKLSAANPRALLAYLQKCRAAVVSRSLYEYRLMCAQSWRRADLDYTLVIQAQTPQQALREIDDYLHNQQALEQFVCRVQRPAQLPEVMRSIISARRAAQPNLLPTYPFTRSRFWVELADAPRRPVTGMRLGTQKSANVTFVIDYVNQPPFKTQDHLVHGRIVIPAAAHLALIINMFNELTGSETEPGSLLLENIVCREALVVDPQTPAVSYRFSRHSAPATDTPLYAVEVSSEQDDGQRLHLQAQISALAAPQAERQLQALQQKTSLIRQREEGEREIALARVDQHRFYDQLFGAEIALGNAFRRIRSIDQFVGKSVAAIEAESESQFAIAPGVLDACLQTISLATGAGQPFASHMSGATIPVAIDRLIVHRGDSPSDATDECLTTLEREDRQQGSFVHHIVFRQSLPRLTLAIEGLLTRRISERQLQPKAPQHSQYFIEEWSGSDLPVEPQPGHKEAGAAAQRLGNTLFVSVGETPAGAQAQTVLAEMATTFTAVNVMAESEAESLAQLHTHLHRDEVQHLLYWLVSPKNLFSGNTRKTQQEFSDFIAVQSRLLLHVIKSLDASATAPVTLTIITDSAAAVSAGETPDPFFGWVLGLCKSLCLEPLNITIKLLDTDAASFEQPVQLARELIDTADRFVAYRECRRYCLKVKTVTPESISLQTPSWRPAATGVYVITGGLGDLALVTARWLIARGARKLALLGRRQPDTAMQARIDQLATEDADIRYYAVDVADYGQLEKTFQVIQQNLPATLCGVIHTAGVLADGIFQKLNLESFTSVMQAKVQGSWNLHCLTANLPLDCFVMYSSIASLFGAMGQSNYAAANGFMDWLARYRRCRGQVALSINWGAWAEVGMAHKLDDKFSNASGLGRLESGQAMDDFSRLLSVSAAQVGTVPFNRKIFSAFWQKQAVVPSLIAELVDSDSAPSQPPATNPALERVLALPPAAKRAAIKNQLLEVVRRIMSLQREAPLQEEKSLREMGFDSIMSIELKAEIQALYRITVPATLIFDYPTIAGLSQRIVTLLDQNGGTHERSEPPLDKQQTAELDHLDEQALAGLLGELL